MTHLQFLNHRVIIIIAIIFFSGLVFSAVNIAPAHAQFNQLNYVSQTVTCSSISVTYNVTNPGDPTLPVLVEAVINGSPLFSANGSGNGGNHTVNINFTPQSPGTNIRGQVSNGTSSDQGSNENCSGGGSPGGGDGEPEQEPPWPGFSDGRISPDPAEYYSIFCTSDQIQVYRAVPETELVKVIALADAIALPIGNEQALGDFMVMERSSEDIVTIYGSNGNLAPEPGSKAFNLNDCVESNGGAPEAPSTGGGPTGSSPPPGEPEETEDEAEARRRREAEESLDFCYESYAFFGGDSEILVDCLDFTLSTYQDVLNGDEILTLIVMIFCLNLIVGAGVLPIGLIWLHRRRNPAAQIDKLLEQHLREQQK